MAAPGVLVSPKEEVVALYGKKTTFATASAGLDPTAASAYGAGGSSNFGLPATESPDFGLNTEVDETRKMTGRREKTTRLDGGNITKAHMTTSLTYLANAYNTVVPMLGLFQNNFTEEALTPFAKRFGSSLDQLSAAEPYDPMFYMSVMKYYCTGSNAVNEIIDAAVTTSMAFSSDGGPLSVTVGLLGARYRNSINLTSPSVGFDTTNAPLAFQNLACDFEDYTGSTQSLILKGFNFTLTSTVTPQFYNAGTAVNSAWPQKIVMGDITCEGSIKIPLARNGIEVSGSGYEAGIRPLLDFLGVSSGSQVGVFDGDATDVGDLQTNRRLRLWWGNVSIAAQVAGDMAFSLQVLLKEPKRTADAELTYEIPFTTARTTGGVDGIDIAMCTGVDFAL